MTGLVELVSGLVLILLLCLLAWRLVFHSRQLRCPKCLSQNVGIEEYQKGSTTHRCGACQDCSHTWCQENR